MRSLVRVKVIFCHVLSGLSYLSVVRFISEILPLQRFSLFILADSHVLCRRYSCFKVFLYSRVRVFVFPFVKDLLLTPNDFFLNSTQEEEAKTRKPFFECFFEIEVGFFIRLISVSSPPTHNYTRRRRENSQHGGVLPTLEQIPAGRDILRRKSMGQVRQQLGQRHGPLSRAQSRVGCVLSHASIHHDIA